MTARRPVGLPERQKLRAASRHAQEKHDAELRLLDAQVDKIRHDIFFGKLKYYGGVIVVVLGVGGFSSQTGPLKLPDSISKIFAEQPADTKQLPAPDVADEPQ